MNNKCISGNVIIENKTVYIHGKKLPECPAKGNSITVINDKVFIDGYEFKKGKWRKTFRAWFHKYF